MTEADTSARRQIQFTAAGPAGQKATFTHDSETWLAYPIAKMRRLHAHADRLIAKTGRAHRELIDLIARRPDLYPDLATTLEVLDSAKALPVWAHDRPEPTQPGPWPKQVRAWAKQIGRRHVTIDDKTDVIVVNTVITQIQRRHGARVGVEVIHPNQPGQALTLIVDGRRTITLHPQEDPDQ